MPVTASVGRKVYEGTNSNHAEEVLFESGKYNSGNLTVDLDAWPCTGERGHNCHRLFQTRSMGRIITVNIGGDHAGYAVNHGQQFGATGTITYDNGEVTYG